MPLSRKQAWRDLGRPIRAAVEGTQFTCFTGTKVQILTHPIRSGVEAIVDVDSWHPGRVIAVGGGGSKVLSLLALLVRKYKNDTS
jgi:hypothetical protein